MLYVSICQIKLLAVIDFKIPKEVWTGKPIDYSVSKIFDYPAYIHAQSGERSKLDLKSRVYFLHLRLVLLQNNFRIPMKQRKNKISVTQDTDLRGLA